MERLTEYHCNVAVIKDKSTLSEAMAKLALYEDIEEQKKVNNGILIHAGADGVFESFEPFAMITCQTIKDYTRLNDALAKVNEKPRNNGDKIRAMTDEELADFIEMKQFFALARNGTDGEDYTLDWLKEEVEK